MPSGPDTGKSAGRSAGLDFRLEPQWCLNVNQFQWRYISMLWCQVIQYHRSKHSHNLISLICQKKTVSCGRRLPLSMSPPFHISNPLTRFGSRPISINVSQILNHTIHAKPKKQHLEGEVAIESVWHGWRGQREARRREEVGSCFEMAPLRNMLAPLDFCLLAWVCL